MQAGKLDRQIVLKSYSETKGSAGGITETYTDVATFWADVIDLRGNQFFAAQQVNSGITTKFRIRYRSDIDARWRIGWKGKEYDIIGVPVEVGRNETLEIMARARDEE